MGEGVRVFFKGIYLLYILYVLFFSDLKDWWVEKAGCKKLLYDREILSDLDEDDDDDLYDEDIKNKT